jgi:hypothetical protein
MGDIFIKGDISVVMVMGILDFLFGKKEKASMIEEVNPGTRDLASAFSSILKEPFEGRMQRGKMVYSSAIGIIDVAEPGFVLVERAKYVKLKPSELERRGDLIGYKKSWTKAKYYDIVVKVLRNESSEMFVAVDNPAPLTFITKKGNVYIAPVAVGEEK